MRKEITDQIQHINDALLWIKQHRPNDYAQKFLQLVEYRKVLNDIAAAEEDNPGIAAFGKSQVGKSYLISCLLQDNGKPYMVRAGDESYNFVFDINPPSATGGGIESTGVVSRFSSFSRHKNAYNADLPVLARVFSAKDIVLLLADSYYNDVMDYVAMSESDIKKLLKSLEDKYAQATPQAAPIISADDVLAMRDYFKAHINNAQSFTNASFFSRLALFIDHIPTADYINVFANLWHNEPNYTRLLAHMMRTLQNIHFAHEVYLPIQAVLHGGIHENTIMSVQCLNQLLEPTPTYTTDVYVRENGTYRKAVATMAKSDICAVCAEVVFKIDDAFLNSTGSYCLDDIKPDVKARINQGSINMSMLNDNDLLDFPGARTREKMQANVLAEPKSLLNCMLRGKVAYIFNKYNEEMRINILLFSHNNKQNDVTELYTLLADWVDKYVGKTPDERAKKIQRTGRSPLFLINTWFNLDLEIGVGETLNEAVANKRWDNRFETVMNNQVLHATDNSWARNWTAPGTDFNNAYVLRDFKFSKTLYNGFKDTGHETGMTDDLKASYALFRETFIHNQYVLQRFADPAMAWDAAASINNDGALYIIENLGEVAARMNEARDTDFSRRAKLMADKTLQAIAPYHVSTDKGEMLKGNIRKARTIFREMDFTCNNDNYFFGRLIQALQMDEMVSYDIVHDIMNSPDINAEVGTFKHYELIRQSCLKAGWPIKDDLSADEQWLCLINTYGFASKEEAEEYLEKKQVKPSLLFSGAYKRKMNSYFISDKVYGQWIENVKSVDFIAQNSGENSFDSVAMGYLVDGLVDTASAMHLNDIMANAIAEYVNVVDIHTASESLVADTLASCINEFVLDFGFPHMTDDEQQAARDICKQEKLPTFHDSEQPEPCSDDELTSLFLQFATTPMALLPSFENNYNCWMDYMFISFVAHLNLPQYDHEANDQLDGIIKSIKQAHGSAQGQGHAHTEAGPNNAL